MPPVVTVATKKPERMSGSAAYSPQNPAKSPPPVDDPTGDAEAEAMEHEDSCAAGNYEMVRVHTKEAEDRKVYPQTRKKQPTYVTPTFIIEKLSGINTVDQEFYLSVMIVCHYDAPRGVARAWKKREKKRFDFEKFDRKKPKFFCANLKDLSAWDWKRSKILQEDDVVKCKTKLRVAGVFMEDMELAGFPFDTQDLTVHLRANKTTQEEIWGPSCSDTNTLFTMPLKYLVMDEWEMKGAVVEFGQTDPAESKSGSVYSTMKICLKIQRRWASYFYRIFVILALINFASLYCFSISPDEVADRGAHIFTIFLTAVAFQFVIQSELPKLPYLTALDKYILLSYFFIGTVAVENFVYGFYNIEDEDLDSKIFYGNLGLWITIHVGFSFYAYLVLGWETAKLTVKPSEEQNLTTIWRYKYQGRDDWDDPGNAAFWAVDDVVTLGDEDSECEDELSEGEDSGTFSVSGLSHQDTLVVPS